MRTGLEIFLEDGAAASLAGARVGVCCNPTAVDRKLMHLLEGLQRCGVSPARLFGPEHGLHATAQDMIAVGQGDQPPDCVSLYGEDEASLRPRLEDLQDLDVLIFDIHDIGSRYYTYQATLGYVMQAAAQAGTRVIVLDRPNPLGGLRVEGNVVQPGFESFVSAWPLATRHGMTMGELAHFFRQHGGAACELEVIPCEGWRRDQWWDETELPWVLPSPNMPTLETAIIYPGMCLIEGTNLSEGRGTTRPFHLVGAPWLNAQDFARLCRQGALDSGLEGVAFRACHFLPQFQKHAGKSCGGVEIHLLDRHALLPVLLGWVVIEAARRCAPEHFAWRTETYEFIDDPIAIDLLCGSSEARVGLELGIRPHELQEAWEPQLEEFMELRDSCLIYET